MIESAPTDFAHAQKEAERQELQQFDASVHALRRFVFRHNWQALALATFAFVTALSLWGLIYVVVYWFALITTTIKLGFDQETLQQVNDPELLGKHFLWWFLLAAVAAQTIAGIVRHRVRLERLREARHYLFWVIAELLMAVPNVTFAVRGNLSAFVRLPAREAANAWLLLQRIHAEGDRMNLASLKLVIEDERLLRRVMFALQIVGLIEMRERREGWVLCLQNREAFAIFSSAKAHV